MDLMTLMIRESQRGTSSEWMKDVKLTKKYMRDVIINFILAGKDTTAYALTMTLFYIATLPEIEKRLLAEIDENIRTDEHCTLSTIEKLEYLNAVIHESLRMSPPVPFEKRYNISDRDVILPNGDDIIAGDSIVMTPCVINMNANVYDEPETFNPERFINPSRTYTDFEWFTFAAGPRKCLGKRFALLEIKTVIVYLLRKFKFNVLEPEKVCLANCHPSFIPQLKDGMMCTVRLR